ncbi:MAG: CBS domain-containing protein [Gammaproteobacteria bacterium]|nr:CBS domain-containing protein [Gammaproteobacteria bacterium]
MSESVVLQRGLIHNFAEQHPEQFGVVLASCVTNEAHELLKNLPTASVIEVLAYAPRPFAVEFIDTQDSDEILRWVHLGSDDAVARIARRLSEDVRANVLTKVRDVNKLRVLREYVNFAKDSVAALADKDFLTFADKMTCAEVRKSIRNLDENDTENLLIVDSEDRVLGLLDDRRLLRSGRKEPIAGCIKRTTLLPASATAKSIVEIEAWHEVDRLPVVDKNRRAIGVLHWDTLIERHKTREETSQSEEYTLVMDIMSTMLDVVKELPSAQKSRTRTRI